MSISSPLDSNDVAPSPSRSRRSWDPVVKVTHWSIVTTILANALITEEGSGAHIWVGYALAAILALRLLWGLIGPAEARLSAFPPSPRRALAHLRDIRTGRKEVHRSHNPLGALMVYAIWSMLGVIIASGIVMAGPPSTAFLNPAEQSGAVTGQAVAGHGDHDDDERDEGAEGEDSVWEEVHETAVNLLYILIALHIAGVVFETRRSGREILLAMLPGRA
ncbi:cytochrome b/b6 domain-containing protein [Sphingopyxis sp.]|uniref:cytochrome b/b6 domain-containing protein n=1 Tax=Sphingopyxis sp. TaxID=1908224 RepID=UPI001D62A4D8|nr:cytochrome b/b6 domain-containing protein [Sphingopyxis sp.]MBW8295685.1 cytochrome b/b6 domain-containing protein [Sphingopyxis sp.]